MTLGSHTVATETALRLVADERCRSVLTLLLESESRVVEFDALATHVTAEETSPEGEHLTCTDPVLLDLRHNLLPWLAAAGVIEYDERSETVRYLTDERVERVHAFVTTELE